MFALVLVGTGAIYAFAMSIHHYTRLRWLSAYEHELLLGRDEAFETALEAMRLRSEVTSTTAVTQTRRVYEVSDSDIVTVTMSAA